MFGKLIMKSGNEVWWILFVLLCLVKVFCNCLVLQVGLNECLYNKLPPWWKVFTEWDHLVICWWKYRQLRCLQLGHVFVL